MCICYIKTFIRSPKGFRITQYSHDENNNRTVKEENIPEISLQEARTKTD
jgi:hypothetical protein